MLDSDLRERCIEALNCWLHQYAADMCDEAEVQRYMELRLSNGGTLHYIATLLRDLQNG